MTRGPYVVLEGGDASGKSKQAKLLVEWLRRSGRAVRHVREPGSTPTGEALRRQLLDPATGTLSALTEALLFSAARTEMLRSEVGPAIDAGDVVLAERCYLSTLVYQGVAGGASLDLLQRVTAEVHDGLWPDRIFVLDVDEDTRRRRADEADKADRFEVRDESFHRAVRNGYLQLAAADPRVEVIDARGAVDTVHDILRRHVESLLGKVAR